MCGIVGYIGNKQAEPVLVEGLSRMEYRGYDSAGVAVLDADKIELVKAKGRVADLKVKLGNSLPGTIGIAHTRWATHGVPSDTNAHPHADCKGDVFVAHNGIIENYRTLKEELIREGHTFKSDTDTEVLAHLIEREIHKDDGDLVQAVRSALKQVLGAYGIVVLSSRYKGTLVAARLGSPLVVGRGQGENIIASDVTAILPITREVIYLDDGEIVEVTKDSCSISDLDAHSKDRSTEILDWSLETAEKGGYEHFMLKEIFEEPDAVKNSMRGRLDFANSTAKLGGVEAVADRLKKISHLTLIGMGTARYACMVGEYMLEEYARIPVEVELGSEYTYKQQPAVNGGALIAVSQSGETADTLLAVKEAKRKDKLSLGIVNVTASSIARETNAGVYNHIGPEIAVGSTKAFVSQMTIFALLTLLMGRQRDMSVATASRIMEEMKSLPDMVKQVLAKEEDIKKVAEKFKDAQNVFFLGRKYNYPIALEGALKMKEIAYIHAEGFNGADLKHGPIALLEKDFPVIVIAPEDSVYEKNISHIQEIKARGGRVWAIATEGDEEIVKLADDVFYIPKTIEMLTPILSIVPIQLLVYYIAVARGVDVDKPRNLAKSVTVE